MSILKSLAVILYCFKVVFGYNVDVDSAVVHRGPGDSKFGFSVSLYSNSGNNWLLIGAPEADTDQPGIEKGGAVYRCSVDEDDNCIQIPFDTKGNNFDGWRQADLKSEQWFGATVRSSAQNGVVVACAPRYVWFSPSYQKREPVGTCFVSRNDFREFSEYAPCRTRSTGHSRQGSCQAGLGAAVSPEGDRLFLGAVGSWYWQGQLYSINITEPATSSPTFGPFVTRPLFSYSGQVFNQNLGDPSDVIGTNEGPQSEDDSYMGYSVAVGNFDGDNQVDTAVGVPRGAKLMGKVVLLTADLKPIYTLTGLQFGAYFGCSVAAVDVNADGLDDIIVGAPLYTKDNSTDGKFETGRVYVAYQNDKHQFRRWKYLSGEVSRSRFGTAVASLGDINQDGFKDFAVGAPYDGPNGKGAVYIFHGGEKEIKSKAAQVIYAEDVDDQMSTFGYALAGALDLDNNYYPDLLVGAFDTNHAVFFKSRPVIYLNANLTYDGQSKQIDLENKSSCKLEDGTPVACTSFTLCVEYSGLGVEDEADIGVQIILDAKLPKSPRLFAMSDPGKSTWNETFILQKEAVYCKSYIVYVKSGIRDKLTPLEAEARFFAENHSASGVSGISTTRRKRGALRPILSQAPPPVYSDAIHIQKNCGPDNICIPNLGLAVKRNVESYILGSDQKIELDVSVSNTGEDSFETVLMLKIPPGVTYVTIDRSADNGKDVGVLCSPPGQDSTLKCDIGNPLPMGRTANFKIVLQPQPGAFRAAAAVEAATGEKPRSSLVFEFVANSTNPEDFADLEDNIRIEVIPIKVETELVIRGSSQPDSLFYNRSLYQRIPKTHESQIGPEVLHVYEIVNKGPSDINEAEVYILWPSLNLAGEHLLYLVDFPEITGRAECSQIEINPLGLQLDGKRKAASGKASAISGTRLAKNGKKVPGSTTQAVLDQEEARHAGSVTHSETVVRTNYTRRTNSSTSSSTSTYIVQNDDDDSSITVIRPDDTTSKKTEKKTKKGHQKGEVVHTGDDDSDENDVDYPSVGDFEHERERLKIIEQARAEEERRLRLEEEKRLRLEEERRQIERRKLEQERQRAELERMERERQRRLEQERQANEQLRLLEERRIKAEEERQRLRLEEERRLRMEEERRRLKSFSDIELERRELERQRVIEKQRIERERLRIAEERRLAQEEERRREEERQRLKQEEAERIRLEAEIRRTESSDETELKRLQLERQRQLELQRIRLELEERQRREEAERLRIEEEDRLRREEEIRRRQSIEELERKRIEEERQREYELHRIRLEEEEKRQKEEEERLRKEDEQRIRAEEDERLRREDEERIRLEEESRQTKSREEIERERLERERQRQVELQRIRSEEKRRRRLEQEKARLQQEEERLRREEEERLRIEEEIRRSQSRIEAERDRLEEERQKQYEIHRIRLEEETRLRKEEEERLRREDEERLRVEKEERQRLDEEARRAQNLDEAERKRIELERQKIIERHRILLEQEEKLRMEEEERRKIGEEERLRREEEAGKTQSSEEIERERLELERKRKIELQRARSEAKQRRRLAQEKLRMQKEEERLRLEEEERLRLEEEERQNQIRLHRLRLQEEEKQRKEEEEERLRREEKERLLAEEEERLRLEEEQLRLKEERLRWGEEETSRYGGEEQARRKEEERLRSREDERRKIEEEERLRLEEERLRKQIEQQRIRLEEEERKLRLDEEQLRLEEEEERLRFEEEERLRLEEEERLRLEVREREERLYLELIEQEKEIAKLKELEELVIKQREQLRLKGVMKREEELRLEEERRKLEELRLGYERRLLEIKHEQERRQKHRLREEEKRRTEGQRVKIQESEGRSHNWVDQSQTGEPETEEQRRNRWRYEHLQRIGGQDETEEQRLKRWRSERERIAGDNDDVTHTIYRTIQSGDNEDFSDLDSGWRTIHRSSQHDNLGNGTRIFTQTETKKRVTTTTRKIKDGIVVEETSSVWEDEPGRRRRRSTEEDLEAELQCGPTICQRMVCKIGHLAKGEEVIVRLRSRVWVQTLKEMGHADVKISSKLVSRITQLPSGIDAGDSPIKSEMITTTIESEKQLKEGIAWWWILLAILFGLLLLSLLICVLWKFGFFKRKRPEDENEKQPLSNKNGCRS